MGEVFLYGRPSVERPRSVIGPTDLGGWSYRLTHVRPFVHPFVRSFVRLFFLKTDH